MIGNVVYGSANPLADISIYVLKIDQYFNTQWAKSIGGNAANYHLGYDIKETEDGGFIIVGSAKTNTAHQNLCIILLTSTGNLQWAYEYSLPAQSRGYSIQETWDNQFIATGMHLNALGEQKTLVVKVDETGQMVWNRSIGNVSTNSAGHFITKKSTAFQWEEYGIAGYIDHNGSLGGELAGRDIHLLVVNEFGDVLASKVYGGAADEEAMYMSVQFNHPKKYADDVFFLAGYTESFGAGSKDAYLLELEWSGAFTRAKRYGDAGPETAYEVKFSGNQLNMLGIRTENSSLGGPTRFAHLIGMNITSGSPSYRTCGDSEEFFSSNLSVESTELALDAFVTGIDILPDAYPSNSDATENILCGSFGRSYSSISVPDSTPSSNVEDRFTIHPNPTVEGATVSIQFQSEAKTTYTIELFDSHGKHLQRSQHQSTHGYNEIALSTRGRTPGIYFIRLQLENRVLTQKLVLTN